MSSTLTSGLVSVTFRALSVEQIIALAKRAELETIEWGGDVHVPHGDIAAAREVRSRCDDAGIAISAYGSYYRAGWVEKPSPSFEDVLASAVALGAPVIRVWAGTFGSAQATAEQWTRVAHDLAVVTTIAAKEGIALSLEYHGGTLTDTPESALTLLKAVNQPTLFSYWQPRHGLTVEENLADLAMLRPYLRDVHAFHWWPDAKTRHPLEGGADRWHQYLPAIAADGRPHVVSLEFVRNDDEQQLLRDAQTLRQLLKQVSGTDG